MDLEVFDEDRWGTVLVMAVYITAVHTKVGDTENNERKEVGKYGKDGEVNW